MRYYRVPGDETNRLIAVEGDEAYDLTAANRRVTSFRDLARAASIADDDVDTVARGLASEGDAGAPSELLAETGCPVRPEEVWAAGVTYEISEEAREAESGMPEVYLDVYESERPEVFFKATPSRTVGPGDAVGIREDSTWDVPEPELGVVLYEGDIVGYTIGNDVSSRSIEGDNPLYLPQAKVYDRCCSLGPCVVSAESIDDPHDLTMSMTITRDGETMYEEATSTGEMARTCEELVSYLTRHNSVPELGTLLTGTSLVPPESFTLREGDRISIEIESIGTLENGVTTV